MLLHDALKVPRKVTRQIYYQKNLVAIAARLNSNMTEMDIIEAIRLSLPSVFERYPLTEFQFLKAIGDSLFSPEINEWDFKTLKHVYQNGPIYIRVTKPLKCFHTGEEDLYKETDLGRLSTDDDDDNYLGMNEPCSSTVPTRVHKVLCPICNLTFDKEQLENHADICARRKFDFLKYSSEEDEGLSSFFLFWYIQYVLLII